MPSVPQRIVLICNSYPPEIGAAPVRMYGIAQLLRRAGHEVTVVAGMPSYPLGRVFPDYRKRFRVTEVHDGITVHRLPYLPSQGANRLLRLGSLGSLAASLRVFGPGVLRAIRPDWVVVSSPPLPLAQVGVALARQAGARVLLNVSDLWPLTALELGALKPGRLYRWLERRERGLFQAADAWMGQSEEILDHIRSQAGLYHPAFLYRNLPEGLAATEAPPASRKRRIVYAGLLGPVQGIAAIAAGTDFAALGLELHIYGDGPDRRAIAAFLQAHPGCGIFLHPAVPAAEMARLLPRYDAALVPLRRSIYGAIPSKLFAAVRAGVPVVFCSGGEGERIVRRHGLGWTAAPGDPASLLQALQALSTQSLEELALLRDHCTAAGEGPLSRSAQDGAFLSFFGQLQRHAALVPEPPKGILQKIRAASALIISAILALSQKF